METKQKNSKSGKKIWIIVAIAVVLALLIGSCTAFVFSDRFGAKKDGGELAKKLAAEGTDTIELTENVIVSEPLVVNGDKTITGSGKILLDISDEADWPETSNPSWGVGCPELEVEDTSKLPAVLTISNGSSLTLSGTAGVNAEGKVNGIILDGSAKLTVKDEAVVENGRYANLVVGEKAELDIQGGSLLESNGYNIINNGTVTISGGTIDGANAGAALYNAGTATQTGGTISGAGMHNVYVASGTFTMSGGANEGAGKDGILIAKGATANVTGGTISNCNHGMCNNGTLNTGKVTLSECGIMNFGTGTLTMQDTTVDTSEVYCLANNGGKVTATNFTAIGCDTCAVYNFSGDMELNNLTIEGSRDGNIATTGGNLTINGAVLDVCRDKSVVVGNGKAVLNNVAIKGTTNEKYGVYAFGGDLYINDSTIENVSSTAIKMDAGSVVNLKNVEIKDVSQNGFQVDGGEIHAENVTMTNMGSHGIYNKNGTVIGDGVTITGIKKNAVQHVGGTTTLNNVTASDTGNHGGYVAEGTLTITNSSFAAMEANGFYLIAGSNKLVLDNVTINGTGQQGINNNSVVEAKNVHISNTGMNGIYNKAGGVVTISDSVIENVSEHGINNKATITITNVTVKNTGADSNGIQNNGTMTVQKTSVTNSKKHGFYNTGKLTAEDITINGTGDNGIYNDHGDIAVTGLQISNAGTQGINNNGTIDVVDVKITGTGKNGIYNSDGTAIVEKLTVSGTGEHGVNNVASMTLKGAVVTGTGEGKNGIQNSGTITITDAQVSDSKNHGIYNKGTFTAKKLSVSATVGNGVYNDGGNAKITDLTINNVGDQGVNNNSTIELVNVTISGTTKNGIYNSNGTAVVTGLTVSGTGEHGINNAAQMTASQINISNTGASKNGLQNSGVLAVQDVTINKSKNHGIYNIGTLSGSDVTILGSADNGIYNYGGTIKNLSNLTITDSVGQGVNNTGSFSASVIEISGAGKNGIYNNGGTANISGLLVEGVGEHGVSNQGTMLLSSSILNGSGKGSNCIQNKGELTLSAVTANGSANHGIYNDNLLVSNGKLTITNAAVNGLYNYGGNVKLSEVEITAAGEHGINNTGTLEGQSILIDGVTANGFQNSGTLKVTGSALITDSGKHGMYNSGTLEGTNITVTNAYDLLASNAGKMIVENLILNGTAHKALYNNGYAELYTATIDGAQVTNGGSAEYLVDNNGGVLDLNDTTLVDAFGTSLHNRGNAVSSLTNVVIDGAGNYGIFVEGGSSLSGDGVVVNNVTKNEAVEKAEGYAIKNQGKITMMDHVTLGAYNDNVSGDGVTPRKETNGIYSTALTNDAATSSYSGYDLIIKNALGGNGVYNKGLLFVKDLVIDNVKDGLVNRYNSWSTLSGDVSITNITRNPISNYGPESGKYVNGLTLVSGSTMHIENAGSHAINNKGSFLAAADTTLTIKNIHGQNINAINNQANATMTLGDVTIDGLYVTISMYNDTTINSNSGNGIQSNSVLVLNGDVVISNLFHKAANDKTENSNGTGMVVKNGGKVTGTGSLTIIGSQTAPEGYEGYQGLFNGILLDNGSLQLVGDISVSNATNQGIYVANESKGAAIGGHNITVDTVVNGNGIYVRYKTGKLTATGNVTVTATGQNAFTNAGQATIAGDLIIHDITTGYNGLRNDGSGTLNVGGDVIITNISGTTTAAGRGNALHSNGKLNVTGNITISGVTTSGSTENTSNNAINGSGVITVGGNVTITDKVAAGHGAFLDQGKLLVTGNIEINGTGTGKQGIYGANETVTDGNVTKYAAVEAGNITIRDAGGNGIYINKTSGKVTVTGDINISGAKDGHGLSTTGTVTAANVNISNTIGSNRNGMEVKGGSVTVSGDITITASGQRGLNSAGTVKATNLIIDGFGENGIQNNGTLNISGAITVNNCTKKGHGIYNGKTLTAGSVSISNVVRNGINNAGEFKVTGEVSVKNAGEGGIGSNKTFTAGAITIDTVTAGPGLNNSGTMTVTGLTSVKNITGKDVSAIQNKNTMTLGDVMIDGVYVEIGNDADDKQMTNVGNGITNTKKLTLNGTATITNVFTTAKNNSIGAGVVVASGTTINGSGSIVIIGTASTSETYPYGINNGIFIDAGTLDITGDISVSDVTNQGIYVANENATLGAGNITITNAGGNGIYINKTTGVMNATGTVTIINPINGHGLSSSGTTTAGNIVIKDCVGKDRNGLEVKSGSVTVSGDVTIINVAKNGLNNAGTVTVTGKLDVSSINAGYGVYSKAGSVQAGEMVITDIKANIALFFEGEATIKAGTISIKDVPNGQAIQMNHKNTFEVGTLIVQNCGKNAMRIYNNNSNPTIKIENMVATNCTEYAVAAQKAITSDNLSIGTLWYTDCAKGAVHGNVKSGVGETKNELPAAEASASAAEEN